MNLTKEQILLSIIHLEKEIDKIGNDYGQDFNWESAKGLDDSLLDKVSFIRGKISLLEEILKEV